MESSVVGKHHPLPLAHSATDPVAGLREVRPVVLTVAEAHGGHNLDRDLVVDGGEGGARPQREGREVWLSGRGCRRWLERTNPVCA